MLCRAHWIVKVKLLILYGTFLHKRNGREQITECCKVETADVSFSNNISDHIHQLWKFTGVLPESSMSHWDLILSWTIFILVCGFCSYWLFASVFTSTLLIWNHLYLEILIKGFIYIGQKVKTLHVKSDTESKDRAQFC